MIQAIIDNTGDNWKGFPFLFVLCTAASLIIWFGEKISISPFVLGVDRNLGVDITEGRRAAVLWAEKNRAFAQTGILAEERDSSESTEKK